MTLNKHYGIALGWPMASGLHPSQPTGGGAPNSIVVDGVTYTRIRFGGQILDQQISSQPLYGKAA